MPGGTLLVAVADKQLVHLHEHSQGLFVCSPRESGFFTAPQHQGLLTISVHRAEFYYKVMNPIGTIQLLTLK